MLEKWVVFVYEAFRRQCGHICTLTSTVNAMSVQITPKPDTRCERLVADPEAYFAQARERLAAELRDERRCAGTR